MTGNVHCVMLAAGASRRLGSPKQLLEFDGKRLIRHAVEVAMTVFGNRIVVVLKDIAEAAQYGLSELELELAANNQWEEGIASSLRLGVSRVPDDARAAMLLTCDQPLVNSVNLESLVDAWNWNQRLPVASAYLDTVGIPAVIPRSLFWEISQLRGDHGAKVLLQKHTGLVSVPVPEAGLDVDTWEDWEEFRARTRK